MIAAPRPLITLTTDFGRRDPYVAAMKGVIVSSLPDAQIIDISHEVAPQDAFDASFILDQAWRYFPPGTVHLVVVDPGVGTERRRVAIEVDGQSFVGPDNGCLSSALPDASRGFRRPNEGYVARPALLPSGANAVAIENQVLFRRPVSATFEGRDLFAPVAAFLAGGGALDDLGPRIDSLQDFASVRAPSTPAGLEGVVIHVDGFGNLITDIRGDDLPPQPVIEVAGRMLPLVHTYAEGEDFVALVGSAGLLEIALPGGDAARELELAPGAAVIVSSA